MMWAAKMGYFSHISFIKYIPEGAADYNKSVKG